MAAVKNLFQEVVEGRITVEEASVILGSKNPDIEYTPDQIQVLELMSQENELNRDFEKMGEDAEFEYYDKLADISDNGRIIDLGFVNDL